MGNEERQGQGFRAARRGGGMTTEEQTHTTHDTIKCHVMGHLAVSRNGHSEWRGQLTGSGRRGAQPFGIAGTVTSTIHLADERGTARKPAERKRNSTPAEQ